MPGWSQPLLKNLQSGDHIKLVQKVSVSILNNFCSANAFICLYAFADAVWDGGFQLESKAHQSFTSLGSGLGYEMINNNYIYYFGQQHLEFRIGINEL